MTSPIDHWHELLAQEPAGAMCARLTGRMRERRLRFGDRVICPFLRPFFLDAADEPRVRARRRDAVDAGRAGRARRRWARRRSFASSRSATTRSGWRESIPATRRPAPPPAPTPSSCRTRCSSPNTTASRRPAPATARGSRSCLRTKPVMAALPRAVRRADVPAGRGAARGARRQLPRVGRHGVAAADGDCRLARGADLQRVRDPARRLRRARRADGGLRSARPRVSRGRRGGGAAAPWPADSTLTASGSIWSTAACSSTTSSRARTSAARCSTPTRRAPCCVANSLRCKIPHKKAFFAVLTDERHARAVLGRRARADPPAHPVDRDRRGWPGRRATAGRFDLLEHLRANREQFVIKPNDEYGGTGVTLGWETSEAAWDAAIARARRRARSRLGGAGADRRPARVVSGLRGRRHRRCATCWSISRRTCSAAGSPVS